MTDDLPLTVAQGPFRTAGGVPTRPDGGIKNVFPVGLSLVEAVFLIPAVNLSDASEPSQGASGYTRFEVNWVAAGLLLIAAIGLQVTYAFARMLVTPAVAVGVTLAGWVGTPLLYYTAWFPFSAHPTTFCLMALLLLVADRLPRATRSNAYLFAFGALAAMLYLIRPHQSFYVVLLAVWRVAPLFRQTPGRWVFGAIAGGVVCAAAIVFQAAVHQLNVGTLTPIAHGQHNHPMISGHFVASPRFDIVLFSPNRGLFCVTPIILLALLGYIIRWRSVPWWGWASLVNAAVQTTILAFWSDPGQGDSFGIRLWAEHVPVVVCGLAVLCNASGRGGQFLRAITITSSFGCVAWTILMARWYVLGNL